MWKNRLTLNRCIAYLACPDFAHSLGQGRRDISPIKRKGKCIFVKLSTKRNLPFMCVSKTNIHSFLFYALNKLVLGYSPFNLIENVPYCSNYLYPGQGMP